MSTSIRILTVALLCACAGLALAATIHSKGTGGFVGDFLSTTTWAEGSVPTAADSVIIVTGDSIQIAAAAGPVLSFTIQTGAKVDGKQSLTGGTSSAKGPGTFTIESGGYFYQDYSSGTKWPQYFTTYSIDPNSFYVQTPNGSSTIMNAVPYTFGNLIVYKQGAVMGNAGNIEILGNLTLNNGSSSSALKGANSSHSNGALTIIHVHGNVKIISGELTGFTDAPNAGGQTAIWNIDGNVTVGDSSTAVSMATLATLSGTNAGADMRTGIFNIGGNLRFINGARCYAGTNTGPTNEIGIIDLKENFFADGSTVTGVGMTGTYSINFVGTGTQTVTLGCPFKFYSSTSAMTMNDTIAAGSTVVFNGGHRWSSDAAGTNGGGQWVVNGSIAFGANDTLMGVQGFTLNSGTTLTTGNPNGLATDGNIQVTGTQTYSIDANYVYNGTIAQVTGLQMPDTIGNLKIANANGVALSKATTIDGVLQLRAGVFDNTIPFSLGPIGSISYEGGSLLHPMAVESPKGTTIPRSFFVDQNYPNPFNPSTTIRYGLPSRSFVSVKMYSLLGQEVVTLFQGRQDAGVHELTFDAASVSSGVYLCRVQADNAVGVKRIMLVK